MQIKKLRGVFCVKRGSEVSPLANGGRPKKRERMRALMGKCVEFWRKLEEVWIFGIFGK